MCFLETLRPTGSNIQTKHLSDEILSTVFIINTDIIQPSLMKITKKQNNKHINESLRADDHPSHQATKM